ncbi:MAG: bifunctional tetrahydrofolate synthase/dihydrofolate synthase [Acidiferrobacteraceae bacterium]
MPQELAYWLSRLETLHPSPMDLGLERVAQVQERLGLRACPFAIVSVAGTNGKGSVVAMLEAMYRAGGFRVGAYTSPHLFRFNERIRVDGADCSDGSIVQAFEQVEQARGDVSLTYFEFGTLAAAVLFRQRQVQVAVLEVGLGGRLDAVNAFDPDVAIVTSIGLDHQEYLGPDRESIAREKAGIFRAGRPAVCGDPEPPLTIDAEARRIGATLFQWGRDFAWRRDEDSWSWRCGGKVLPGLPLPVMRGIHQLHNAASAVMATELLRARFPVSAADVRAGLMARLPARFEVRSLPGEPEVIFDVAHNGAAASSLAANLAAMPLKRRTLAVCGVLRDKPVEDIGRALAGSIDVWHLVTLPGIRGAPASEIGARLRTAGAAGTLCAHPDPMTGFRAARAEASAEDRIVVFGSFLTVSAIMRAP